MANTKWPNVDMRSGRDEYDGPRPPKLPPGSGFGEFFRGAGMIPTLLMILIGAGLVYSLYFWFIRRVVVGPDEVLVLLKKDGSRSLPGDQIIIPRAPDRKTQPQKYAEWERTYGDANGVFEEVFLTGTYFRFSPFDYERKVVNIKGDTSEGKADVASNKVGIVIKKFGQKLDPGQILADLSRDQRGPLPGYLQPGRHYQYANPYAYEIKQVDPIFVDPGHRGVVTVMAGRSAQRPNQYLVSDDEQGVQRRTEPEGFIYANPFEKRITPISIRSQRFEMAGREQIQFPSSDSFDIKLEGFVEWSIMPERLPEMYVKYTEGGELIPLVEQTMILPYARSYSRLVGSQYNARDFISGDTKLKFQAEFEAKLREACAAQGVEILQARVRDIIPPEEIKQPINDREIAKEQILQYEQQMKVAESMARLTTQEETGNQNRAIGEANTQVVTVIKDAERARDVALKRAQQDLAVAKLRLEASQKQADAVVAKGQAEANVILLQKQAEAEPLRQQVAAFGGGDAYARYFFYQQVAPSIKSILSNTEGPFADMFKQFTDQPPAPGSEPGREKVTGVQR
jgi:regulator of protease activity HflC (stomatin/prohibitin superfamily)